jgi:hypothetical protein
MRWQNMGLNDIDITKNIKIIEWLKSEQLNGVASIFNIFAGSTNDIKTDLISSEIANVILVSYLLGKRLGIEFSDIDSEIKSKLNLGITEKHEIEKRYGDLSLLLKHIEKDMQSC